MGRAAEVVAPSSSIRSDGGCPVVKINDLSRSLAAFDPISTLVVVVEMSKASWLVSGVVPGVERPPRKAFSSVPMNHATSRLGALKADTSVAPHVRNGSQRGGQPRAPRSSKRAGSSRATSGRPTRLGKLQTAPRRKLPRTSRSIVATLRCPCARG
jgi:hypothetical protein